MTKLIFPREGRYLRVDTIRECVNVKNYIEKNYERQELRAFSKCNHEYKTWIFNSINSVLSFYAYMLNHLGIDGFKIRVKQRISPPLKRQG